MKNVNIHFCHFVKYDSSLAGAAYWRKVASAIIWRYLSLTWIWGSLGWSALTTGVGPLPPSTLSSPLINAEALLRLHLNVSLLQESWYQLLCPSSLQYSGLAHPPPSCSEGGQQSRTNWNKWERRKRWCGDDALTPHLPLCLVEMRRGRMWKTIWVRSKFGKNQHLSSLRFLSLTVPALWALSDSNYWTSVTFAALHPSLSHTCAHVEPMILVQDLNSAVFCLTRCGSEKISSSNDVTNWTHPVRQGHMDHNSVGTNMAECVKQLQGGKRLCLPHKGQKR